MALTENQQLIEQIKKSNSVLIVCEKNYSIDGVSSALALLHVLERMNKKVDIVCDGFRRTSQLQFLPDIDEVKPSLDGVQQTILTVDTRENKITDFSYNVEDDRLYIYLTPQQGTLTEKQVKVTTSGYKYDLVITVDVDDFHSIGPAYDKNTEFFFDTPVINIAHNPENEQYGQINKVDLTKTSVAEVLYSLFTEEDAHAIDQNVATCLLTGIISKTKGFKTHNVTPRTLHIASDLIERGANRELIIQKLYQTKSINTLKLWGTALARLTKVPGTEMAWSYITQQDFTSLQASTDSLREIIEELIVNAPEAQVIGLFYSDGSGKNKGLLYSGIQYDSLALSRQFNPFGTKVFAEFVLEDGDIAQAAHRAVEAIRQRLT